MEATDALVGKSLQYLYSIMIQSRDFLVYMYAHQCWGQVLNLTFTSLGLELYTKSMGLSFFVPGLDLGTSGLDPNTDAHFIKSYLILID